MASQADGRILERHYGTIGIHDVFLSPPPHPFLSTYLNNDKDSDFSSFASWEMVGTIKETPEDFIVREVFQKQRKIPGLTEDDMALLRVSNLLPSDKRPRQNLEDIIKREKAEEERANIEANQKQQEERERKAEESPPGTASLEAYSQKVRAMRKELSHANDDLDKSLEKLSQMALERLKAISSGDSIRPQNNEVDVAWIPPSCSDSNSEASRQERGVIFRSLKKKYPLLLPDSVTKNETEKWIRVIIDVSYDELIQYLYLAVDDLKDLLLFQKLGVDGQKEFPKKTTVDMGKQQHVDGRGYAQKDAAQVILRLKPGLAKEDRRKVHHLIASNCKMFATSTLNDYPLPTEDSDGSERATTVAVVVSWQKGSKRGGRKRKRGNDVSQKKEPHIFPNLLCVVKKRRMEHLSMIQKLTQMIKRRQGDIGLAGIKDMQAVTYQFCTLRNTKPDHVLSKLNQLERQGIELGNFYKVDWLLNKGDLDGNEFEIRIRSLKRIQVTKSESGHVIESFSQCDADHIALMVQRIQKCGFINFFGPQRVGAPGESGATAHGIGQAMLQQNFNKAIDLLMLGRSFNSEGEQEKDSFRRARQLWKETKDPNATLKALGGGDSLPRERAVLKGLNRYGADQPLQAIQCLNHSMRIFWVNAYQSFIWNQAASARMKMYGTQIVKGDMYVEKDDINLSNVKLVQNDADVASLSLDQIVLPLPGYRVEYPQNDIGTVYQNILEKDRVKFDKSAPVEATAKGAYRRLIVQPPNIKHEVEKEDDKINVKLKFQLPKGSYATMLMRELMLTTATRNNSDT